MQLTLAVGGPTELPGEDDHRVLQETPLLQIPDQGYATTEITEGGIVLADGDVTVSAFEVPHGGRPAVGCRVEYRDRPVVISADTSFSERLIEEAEGTDLLIHEVFDPISARERYLVDESRLERLNAIHTVAEAAAKVFSAARPKVAVAYHLRDSEALSRTIRALYEGAFVAGEDLMTLVVGDDVEFVDR